MCLRRPCRPHLLNLFNNICRRSGAAPLLNAPPCVVCLCVSLRRHPSPSTMDTHTYMHAYIHEQTVSLCNELSAKSNRCRPACPSAWQREEGAWPDGGGREGFDTDPAAGNPLALWTTQRVPQLWQNLGFWVTGLFPATALSAPDPHSTEIEFAKKIGRFVFWCACQNSQRNVAGFRPCSVVPIMLGVSSDLYSFMSSTFAVLGGRKGGTAARTDVSHAAHAPPPASDCVSLSLETAAAALPGAGAGPREPGPWREKDRKRPTGGGTESTCPSNRRTRTGRGNAESSAQQGTRRALPLPWRRTTRSGSAASSNGSSCHADLRPRQTCC